MKASNSLLASTLVQKEFFIALVIGILLLVAQPAVAQRKVFSDSIIPIPNQAAVSNALNIISLSPHGYHRPRFQVEAVFPTEEEILAEHTMRFSISLQMRNLSELQQRIATNALISHTEMVERYLPTASDCSGITNWLETNGLTLIRVSPDRLNIFGQGTCFQVQKAFQVGIADIKVNGAEYYSVTNAPSVPAEIGDPIIGIGGLQPFLQLQRQTITLAPVLPARSIANGPPYLVRDIFSAYDAQDLGVDGSGQTIAILIDTIPDLGDLNKFWSNNSLSITTNQISFINVTGNQLPPTEGEETLDVEWSSGIAPGAKIKVYAAGSLEPDDLTQALDQILEDSETDPSLRQLSISLGLGENYMPKATVLAERQMFATLTAQGVSIFVSSGDDGSYPIDPDSGSKGPLQPEYQSSDVNVTAVGGTSLRLTPAASEVAWPRSGGGISQNFSRPPWQRGSGVLSSNTSWRLVPDVSLVADRNTGVWMFYHGAEETVGGTSIGAPVWAGFCALINEGRAKNSMGSLGLLNPRIYPLIGTSNFHDITVGNNGYYSACPGYDMVTGIGTPDVKKLLYSLSK